MSVAQDLANTLKVTVIAANNTVGVSGGGDTTQWGPIGTLNVVNVVVDAEGNKTYTNDPNGSFQVFTPQPLQPPQPFDVEVIAPPPGGP
jgi:hypothetical protein